MPTRRPPAPPAPRRAAAATPKAQRGVQSMEVGGRLLLALAGHPAAMSLKDLAAAAGLPASRAHPYLVSFGKLGLIEQQPGSGRYALGPAALQLGLAALHQLDPLAAAQPEAEALAAATGHAVALAVWANFGATVVRLVEAREPLHIAMRVGTVMDLLGTATGRAFAASLPPAQLQAAQGSGRLPRAALAAAAAELREHGVARAVGAPIPGINAFSAVVRDHEGRPALVVTAMGHEQRFAADWDGAMAQAVRDAAARISARLGARDAAIG